ncbi:MAG TPA: methyltransferase domain-containing protein, partial [Fibrobacteria bacterium]|nr:methyltransferase domain-containing protein [Fibrobacteria bacterium]
MNGNDQAREGTTSQTGRICRNCGSARARVSPKGLVAPFFLKRVHGIEVDSVERKLDLFLSRSRSRFKKTIVRWFRDWALRAEGSQSGILSAVDVHTDLRLCPDCLFVGPDRDYPFDQLQGLYRDYRSATYDEERCRYEPWYRELRERVGKASQEEEVRMGLVEERLARHADLGSIHRVIDWGGGEGRFVPPSLRSKEVWILDVSDEPLVDPAFHRVETPPPATTFQFAQVCHVLEHVCDTKAFLEQVVQVLDPGTLLYLEVPQDRTDEQIRALLEDRADFSHALHEHL